MKVLKRIRFIIEGKTESLLGRLEDPEEQLSLFVKELNEQLASLQKAVACAIADEKRLKAQTEDLLARADEWENRAVLALEDGNELLAKEALLKKEECDAQAVAAQKGWKAQKEATEQLKTSLQAMKQTVAEAKRKYTLLLARYKAAETKKKIHDTLSACCAESPMVLMERLTDKIHKVEAEAEAALDLSGEPGDTELEVRFAEMERKKKGDQALDLLKAKLAQQVAAAPSSEVGDDTPPT
jgi:phage shock protein A